MKLYRRAVVAAGANPVAFAAGVVAIATLFVVVCVGLGYLASSVPPYGFYYDLGVDILATSTIAHWLQHWADFKDALGWAGWGDRSAFAFAPMTSVAISVTLAKLFGSDATEAVKAVQVLQVLGAAASAFYLYVVLRGRRSPWAWLAAVTYALAAEQLLMIRGDLSFGFAAALAPLAAAVPLVLVRRYGLWALPICAAFASLLSAYFTIEHLFLQGIPAYAIAIVLAYDKRRRLAWALASAGGLAIVFASIAYVVLPTQASMALFSPSATVGAALTGGEFTHYQNGPLALASLTMNELIANPRKEFAVGPFLFLTVPVGVTLWVLALTWIAGSVRRRTFAYGELAFAVVALVCVVLSTGALIPGIGAIWWVISQLPVLDNIRTPDRFIAFGVVAACVFAVSQLERLSSHPRRAFTAGALSMTLCLASLALFFVFRTFLGDVVSIEDKEPYLGAISAIAQQRDNRVANLALVDKGSVFDTSLYGAPMPFLDFQGDFAERYEGDGLGGAGLLARGNVTTIVASPPWTPDSPLFGQSTIAHSSFLTPLTGDATTVAAYGVDPVRGYVRGVERACLFGGPGLLDHLVAMPAFTSTALDVDSSGCGKAVYADEAPLEAQLGGKIVYRWPALALFAHAGVMRDIDYRLALGRFLINLPWYRNSIDGDSPVLGPAALSLDAGYQTSSVFEIDTPGTYTLRMHVVCHGAVRGRLEVDRSQSEFACKPAAGFQWVGVSLGRLAQGLHGMTLVFDTIGEPAGALSSTWRLAFDGAAIVTPAAASPPASSNAYVISASRLDDRSAPRRPAGTLAYISADGMEPFGPAKPNGAPPLLARSPNAAATYRWNGPAGRYRIWATAYTEGSLEATSFVSIAADGRCCAGVATSGSGRGTTMMAHGEAMLHDGSLVRVQVHGEAADAAYLAQLLDVSAEPEPFPARLSDDRSRAYADFDFLGRVRHIAPQIPTFGTPPQPGHNDIEHFSGVPVSAPLTFHVTFPPGTDGSPTTLHVGGDFSSGPLRATMQCGGATTEGSFLASSGDLALAPTESGNCTVTLSSVWSTLYVADLTLSRAIASYDLAGRRWLSAGRYRVFGIRRDGDGAPVTTSLDGRRVRDTLDVARDGFHELTWTSAPSDAYLLALVPVTWSAREPAVRVQQIASARWRVALDRPATLEGAVFPDGYWRLIGNGVVLDGHRCDLENTCFSNVPRGTYVLLHVWPAYITAGFLITLLAWLIAVAALLWGRGISAAA